MKLGKTFLFSTVLAAGAGLAMGATDAHASETYTVEAGDTLSKISHKFAGNDSLVEAIAKANKISNVNMIFAGQELTIDSEGKAAKEEKTQAVETVQETTTIQASTEVPAQEAAPVQAATAPVQQTQAAPVQEAAPAATTSSAKEWIAQRESGGSYSATNGQYIGRYQLSASYLNGDYSEANQERVADQYVTSRYGSWEGAQAFWQANGWY
ncbi:aggregation-promoting factor [Enterococcus raffinosus]|uniref:LysM peptidoglycan-binding domain-containing protein n=1 Tax=Enterococcus raffinosus TaxID=71452 RepID=A0AAW8T3T2_9ENTE|nr:LysM peptidoglycan-binding domain-containing protein [Enterococcus raffinosus]MDT2521901.1 LysM peptidoglycan-binding domain-containing protein [Enterococcus raffinosus]MDT2531843.1 LysM peptidoglycan-binding domain-containing protein [Enterococcus raffinosus]MDT2533289.1 LysM peptidoglycan-binding domain-containing protein [Enterococcus raffinosus]MDT2543730.1 LysM peptidoglycan-binding domain-containing protein [Enterococcus raffinosus]MDT2553843.1 LysM peptidoglycan-binding domain-contai